MSGSPSEEPGFTLIETVIAMLIMSIAVLTIVGALAAMIGLASEHRGHAVVEAGAHSFAQAVVAQGAFQTTLATAIPLPTTTLLSVTDASLLPAAGSDSYVQVNREVMRVLGVNRSAKTISVTRAVSGAPPSGGHAAGDAVIPFQRCPGSALLQPDPSTYVLTRGLYPSITQVEYWRPSVNAFALTSSSSCGTDFSALCGSSDFRPECTTGLLRITLSIKSSDKAHLGANYDARFKDVDTTTVVLVRRGGT